MPWIASVFCTKALPCSVNSFGSTIKIPDKSCTRVVATSAPQWAGLFAMVALLLMSRETTSNSLVSYGRVV